MTRYMLPGLESMSEFVGTPVHEFGDCGPDATLLMLHAVSEGPYPLSPYGLGAIDAWEQAHGWAASNGAQNINSMDAALHALGVAHTTVGYGDFTLAGLHSALQAGYSATVLTAFIIETSTVGLGIPDDERAVQYHFFGVGGLDSAVATPDGHLGGYLRVDGDSSTDSSSGGLTPPILTSWQEIANTNPIAYIAIPWKVVNPVWTIDKNVAGNVTGARDDQGHQVGAGFAAVLISENLTAEDGLMNEEYYNATSSVCGLADDVLLLYSQAAGVTSAAHGGHFAAEMMGLLKSAQQALAQQAAVQQAEEAAEATAAPAVNPAPSADEVLGAAIRMALESSGFTHS